MAALGKSERLYIRSFDFYKDRLTAGAAMNGLLSFGASFPKRSGGLPSRRNMIRDFFLLPTTGSETRAYNLKFDFGVYGISRA